MSDYDHCNKHNLSFLVPEYMMCPKCAVDDFDWDSTDCRDDAVREYIKDLENQVAEHNLNKSSPAT